MGVVMPKKSAMEEVRAGSVKKMGSWCGFVKGDADFFSREGRGFGALLPGTLRLGAADTSKVKEEAESAGEGAAGEGVKAKPEKPRTAGLRCGSIWLGC